jgi:ketosteroid isomerase-like protein
MIRLSARGSESGAPVESKTAHLIDFRGDRIAAVRVYLDRDEARGAAGLSRQ